tara:strand:+ start:622 stop:948 length:327 start_codon:yes stop_codon:yes gene_type:complete
MANRYVPDLSAFDQFSGVNDSMSLEAKFRVMRRNFELISKALNQVEIPASTSITSIPGTSTIEELNYFTRIWVISKSEVILVDDIYATTGIKLNSTGSLTISGELKII